MQQNGHCMHEYGKDAITRLNRVAGQINGIVKMIPEALLIVVEEKLDYLDYDFPIYEHLSGLAKSKLNE